MNAISENETRDLVMRAIINHKSFRPYRRERLLTDPRSPNQGDSKTVAALRGINEWCPTPSIIASTPGSQARRVPVAAAIGKGITYTALGNAIGPLQRRFVAECFDIYPIHLQIYVEICLDFDHGFQYRAGRENGPGSATAVDVSCPKALALVVDIIEGKTQLSNTLQISI